MSAASKATALFIGAAGTLTVGGAVLFGALAGGVPGSGESPGPGTPSSIIATEAGLGGFEDEPLTFLLAQAEEAQVPGGEDASQKDNDKAPAPEEKEDAPGKADDEAKVPEVAEKDDDAAATTEAMDKPEEDEASGGQANSGHRGPAVSAFRQLSAKDLKVYEALDQEVTLEFPDNTLGEIVSDLKELTGVPVRLDEQALTDAELDGETRMKFIGTHSLDDALSMLLENINGTALDTYVERGVLHITTAEKTQSLIRLRFYDLNNEAEDGSGIENLAQAVEQYIKSIEGGEKIAHVISLGDSLAIQAPLSYHKQIDEFIAGALKLAEARRAAGRPLPIVPPRTPTSTESIQPAAQAGGGGGSVSIPVSSPSR